MQLRNDIEISDSGISISEILNPKSNIRNPKSHATCLVPVERVVAAAGPGALARSRYLVWLTMMKAILYWLFSFS
jgi:hypothetical protein